MTRSIKIALFTDIVCPWCLIGSIRLDQAIEDLPSDVAVSIEHQPFYLDPDTPTEGHDVGEMLRLKYGREPHEIWAHAESQARESGIELDLSRQPRSYPTQKGHTLIRFARAKGTEHALANAITWAYFMEHRQINDDAVLVEIACQHGFARDEALQVIGDTDEVGTTHDLAMNALYAGIRGVPFFVFEGRFAISGCQPRAVFDRALRLALGDEAFPASA